MWFCDPRAVELVETDKLLVDESENASIDFHVSPRRAYCRSAQILSGREYNLRLPDSPTKSGVVRLFKF